MKGWVKEVAQVWLLTVLGAVGWIWLSTNADVDARARSAMQASQLYDGASLTVLCIIAVTVAFMWGSVQSALESLMQSSKARGESRGVTGER